MRPNIEGYLAMAYLQSDQLKMAAKVRSVFDAKRDIRIWRDDLQILELAAEVDLLFND